MRKQVIALVGAALIGTGVVSIDALGQGSPQVIQKVDVTQVATGFRSSKVVGATVVNDNNDTIGKIDDVIVSNDGKAPYVVLSVGGFLGVGSKLVAVRYENLHISKDKIVLPGGNKDELKSLPEFKYATG